MRHHPPAVGDHQQRRGQVGDGGTRIARAENAHRRALSFLAEPGRGVSDAGGERTAGQAHEQAECEVLPVLRRERQSVDGDGDDEHLHEKDDATPEAVGENAQWQSDQRAGQNRRGDQ